MKGVPRDSCGASRNGLRGAHIVEIRTSAHIGRGTVRTVFGDIVQVVPADDDSAGHLRGDDTAGEDATADGDLTGERALLV